MPKRTLKQIAENHGITRDKLNAIRAKGVNVYNDSELKKAIGKQRHRMASDAKIPEGDSAGDAQTLEEIEDEIRKSKDIEVIKILKAKLDALKVTVSIRKETRELIDVGEVRQSITKIVSAARGELLKLSSDLPPRLAGLGEAKMQPLIRSEIVEILTRLADESGSLYAD